jgi:hypothetical protein
MGGLVHYGTSHEGRLGVIVRLAPSTTADARKGTQRENIRDELAARVAADWPDTHKRALLNLLRLALLSFWTDGKPEQDVTRT